MSARARQTMYCRVCFKPTGNDYVGTCEQHSCMHKQTGSALRSRSWRRSEMVPYIREVLPLVRLNLERPEVAQAVDWLARRLAVAAQRAEADAGRPKRRLRHWNPPKAELLRRLDAQLADLHNKGICAALDIARRSRPIRTPVRWSMLPTAGKLLVVISACYLRRARIEAEGIDLIEQPYFEHQVANLVLQMRCGFGRSRTLYRVRQVLIDELKRIEPVAARLAGLVTRPELVKEIGYVEPPPPLVRRQRRPNRAKVDPNDRHRGRMGAIAWELGIERQTIWRRIKAGWTVEAAYTTPHRNRAKASKPAPVTSPEKQPEKAPEKQPEQEPDPRTITPPADQQAEPDVLFGDDQPIFETLPRAGPLSGAT